MKNLKLWCIGALTVGFMGCGQNTEVPQPIKDAFSKKFPEIKKVKWDKESKTGWEAEFKMNGMEYSANFSEDGTWKETEHEVKKSEIPSNVKKTLETEFTGYKIGESEISETAKGSVYEFELEKGELNMEVGIDINGKVVKKEIKGEDKEDKD